MPKIVVVGGGASGISAAIAAKKAGADVSLLERTDLLFGGAIRAGRMSYNGKIVAEEELKAMGGTEVLGALESLTLHKGNIINEENAYIYHAGLAEPLLRDLVKDFGIEIMLEAHVVDVEKSGRAIKAVLLKDGSRIEGDAFVDCTGNSGGLEVCTNHGKGCVMCVYHRCFVFGDRVSIATKAGAPTLYRVKADGTKGTMGVSIHFYKDSLSPYIQDELKETGIVTIPLPSHVIDYSKLLSFGAVRTKAQIENLNIVDIGITGKCVGLGPVPLKELRKIAGLERVMMENPYGGGICHQIGNVDITPVDGSLKSFGLDNVFCAGEKIGCGGVAEVICLGYVAGNNASRLASRKEPLMLSEKTTALGKYIGLVAERFVNEKGRLTSVYSFAHGPFFEYLKEKGFYPASTSIIHDRIKKEGLQGILSKKVA